MSLTNDIVSIENFVKAKFPTAMTGKQRVPKSPTANTFVVRMLNDGRTSETGYHARVEREYQIVYYGTDEADVMAQMDTLSSALYQTQVIPINGSLRYIRLDSFSFSQPFETGGGIYACIGVLRTEVREARTQAAYTKIQHVYTRFTTN